MSYDQEISRFHKPASHSYLWGSVTDPIKCGWFFPAKHCHDLQFGIDQGKITTDTALVLFERDPEIMKHIKQFCRENCLHNTIFFNIRFEDFFTKVRRKGAITNIHGDDIMSLYNLKRPSDILKAQPFSCPDIAFFDFCGDITSENLNILERLCPWLQKTVVGFTFSVLARNNKLYDGFEENVGNYLKIKNTFQVFPSTSPCYNKGIFAAELACKALRNNAPDHLMMYQEPNRLSMIFLLLNMNNKEVRREYARRYQTKIKAKNGTSSPDSIRTLQALYASAKSAGIKAWIKRKINKITKSITEMEAQYKTEESAGQKAAIRRKINMMKG